MTGRPGYDLHTHSVHSDGTTRPSEIATEAAELGLAGFALTDHDTVDGWAEARETAHGHGIDFLPGIELTTKHNWKSRHLLGYGIDPGEGELMAALDRVLESRFGRARHMVDLLAVDYAITWDLVVGASETLAVGRPHIADALVAGGYFVDRGAAFAEVLHPRSPYYVPTYALDTIEAIRLVRQAGGVAVLAHPVAERQSTPTPPDAVRDFAGAGLSGIELEHPENRADWLPPLREVTAELGLLITGSSDYHGAGKPNRLGHFTTPAATVELLRAGVATPR